MAGYKSKKKAAQEKIAYPIVTKGSHLTVTEYEDGRTELVWDHDALQRDVDEAIKAYEKTKKAKK